jgi:glutamate N-acetyltransferase / amino-acid N-acetyltransferase
MTDSLPLVRGFRFAGISAGIKKTGAKDLALVAADRPAPTAGVFTRNLVRAAPVEISEHRLRGGKAQALLANSGNANACTGKEGHAAAIASSRAVARALGVREDDVLPSSTGVIGVLLPGEKVIEAAPALVSDLSHDGASRFAEAIMTTDRFPKAASATFRGTKGEGVLLGIAKGAGMIHPDMATTLGFLVTDVSATPAYLRRALRAAVARTLNRISVDGDTSTNDSFYLMASGASAAAPLRGGDAASKRFERALEEVLESLGRAMVSDGEGAEHAVRIEVVADTEKNALKVARTIASSLLVKTALHGCDPNWGRIIAAAGRAGVKFDPARAEMSIGDVRVFRRGLPVFDAETERAASAVMKEPHYSITLSLGTGRARAHVLTSDLGHEYVRINADYRS